MQRRAAHVRGDKKLESTATDFILASASPRRRDLLSRQGYWFSIDPADIDESSEDSEPATFAAARLAVAKAETVALRRAAGCVVLGADTIVVLDGRAFGKPTDEDDAVRMLGELSGRTHTVVTGWALVKGNDPTAMLCTVGFTHSQVRMREIGNGEARRYAATGEPLDKAGSYALQGQGRALVAAVVGSADNVIGLPVAQVEQALLAFGVKPDRPAAS